MVDQRVGGQHADAAAIGEDGEPVAIERLDPAQSLDRGEQFLKV